MNDRDRELQAMINQIFNIRISTLEQELHVIDPLKMIQVRDIEHIAPPDMVEAFRTVYFDPNNDFPAVILTEDLWIVAGNTRIRAALQVPNKKTIKAFILPFVWDSEATDRSIKDKIQTLAWNSNTKNGTPYTKAEREREAKHRLATFGDLPVSILVKEVGLSDQDIYRIRDEFATETRLKKLNLDLSLSPSAKRELGKRDVQALDDSTFSSMALVAHQGSYSGKDVRKLMSADVIQTAIKEVNAEIAERAAANQYIPLGKLPYPAQLRNRLNSLISEQPDRPVAAFVEHDLARGLKHSAFLDKALSFLGRVKDAQLEENYKKMPRSGGNLYAKDGASK